MTSRSRLHLLVFAALLASCLTSVARAELVEERKYYEHDGRQHYGWKMYDDSLPTPRPAIILFHEWWGLDEFATDRGRALAEMGYLVLCADMYGLAEDGNNIVAETAEEAAERSGALYADRSKMRRLASRAFLELTSDPMVDPSRIATIGYGFGGTCVIELARSGAPLKGFVAYHPGLAGASADDRKIRAETLVLVGADDPMVSDADVTAYKAEMARRKSPYTIIEFSGAEHAFSNMAADYWRIPGASYDKRATDLAWEQVDRFFERALGGTGAGERKTDQEDR